METEIIAAAAGHGVTAADVEAFAALIAAHAGNGRAPIHAARAAVEAERTTTAKFHRDPAFRRAALGVLAGTYDEFRAEAS